jgi:adenosylcobyric acid synthase
VIPWYDHIQIEAEDSVAIENPAVVSRVRSDASAIAVIRLPHISNFTDFDPLSNLTGLNLFFIEKPQDLSIFNAVVLPGSKNTRWDLNWLKKTGWADIIKEYVDAKGHVLGICGGYQMMGRLVHDPQGLEGTPGTSRGLDLLPVETVLKAPKTTTLTRFSWQNVAGVGYEIHMGETQRLGGDPLFSVFERNLASFKSEEGCITQDSKLMGTYMHGMFDSPALMQKWLQSIGLEHIEVSDENRFETKDNAYDLLATHFENHMDTDAIFDLM